MKEEKDPCQFILYQEYYYTVKWCEYELLDIELALSYIMNYALKINHPLIKTTPEYILIEELQFLFSDEVNLKNKFQKLKFYSFQELSIKLGLSNYWVSEIIKNNHIPREGDTIMKIRYVINQKLIKKRKEDAIHALNKYLSYGRYRIMNKRRISKWLSSRYGEEYGDVYLNPYPLTQSGLLRLVDKILNEYPSDWNINYGNNYRNIIITQMGMDVIGGESICSQDISQNEFYLHHIFYWKCTSDFDQLIGTNRKNHPSISHPGVARKKIKSYMDMMKLIRAKENFKKFKPPEFWTDRSKKEYYERLRFYKIFRYEIFLRIRGYITERII